jgi:hypothetical protein
MTSNKTTIDINEVIKNYVSVNKPTVYILTPCYGSLCYCNYVLALIETRDILRGLGINCFIEFCRNDSLVPRARNNLVAKAMNNPNMTHILFIDADITWNPYDVLKLLLSDKELIGGIYPLKKYNWDKLTTENLKTWIDRKNSSKVYNVSNSNMIQHNLVNYNVNFMSNKVFIEQNLAKIKHLPTGFMMIKRDVITKLQQAYPNTKYKDDINFFTNPNKEELPTYALFDCGVEDGHYYSEDWLFCDRWSKIGGEIYMDVSINLTHTGNEDFVGNYLSSIM